jgi:hypothetical protein
MKTLCTVLGALLFLLPWSSTATAGVERGQGEMFGFVGGFMPANVPLTPAFTQSIDQAELDYRNAVIFGFGSCYNFLKHWGIEASIAYAPSNEKFRFVQGDVVDEGQANLSFRIYTADILYYLNPNSPTVFFVSAGSGATTLAEEGNPFHDSYYLFDIGTGLKWKLSHSFYLRFDVRDYIFHLDLRDAYGEIANGWMHNPTITGGIGAYF